MAEGDRSTEETSEGLCRSDEVTAWLATVAAMGDLPNAGRAAVVEKWLEGASWTEIEEVTRGGRVRGQGGEGVRGGRMTAEACLSTMVEPCRKLRMQAWALVRTKPGVYDVSWEAGESPVLRESMRLLEQIAAVVFAVEVVDGPAWSAAARPVFTHARKVLEECAWAIDLNIKEGCRVSSATTMGPAAEVVADSLSILTANMEYLARCAGSAQLRCDRVHLLLSVLIGAVEAVTTLVGGAARGSAPEVGACMLLNLPYVQRSLTTARAELARARSVALWGDDKRPDGCPGSTDGARAMEALKEGLAAVMRTAEAVRVDSESASRRWTGGAQGAARLVRVVGAVRAIDTLLMVAQVDVERRWGGYGGVHAHAARGAVLSATSTLDCVCSWLRESRRAGPERADDPRTAALLAAVRRVPKLQLGAARACGPAVAGMTPAEVGSLLRTAGSALRPVGRVVGGIGGYVTGFAAGVAGPLIQSAAGALEYAGGELTAQAGLMAALSYQPSEPGGDLASGTAAPGRDRD